MNSIKKNIYVKTSKQQKKYIYGKRWMNKSCANKAFIAPALKRSNDQARML